MQSATPLFVPDQLLRNSGGGREGDNLLISTPQLLLERTHHSSIYFEWGIVLRHDII